MQMLNQWKLCQKMPGFHCSVISREIVTISEQWQDFFLYEKMHSSNNWVGGRKWLLWTFLFHFLPCSSLLPVTYLLCLDSQVWTFLNLFWCRFVNQEPHPSLPSLQTPDKILRTKSLERACSSNRDSAFFF